MNSKDSSTVVQLLLCGLFMDLQFQAADTTETERVKAEVLALSLSLWVWVGGVKSFILYFS